MSRRRTTRNTRITNSRKKASAFFADVNARGGRERWQKFVLWTGRVVRFSIITALCWGAYFGATRGWKALFWENPDYALKTVTVTNPNGSLTHEFIVQSLGVKTGQNIMSYDLGAMRDQLKQLPQVEAAEVRRYLPNRLEVRIIERRPVAWVVQSPGEHHLRNPKACLVDAKGNWFRPKQVPHEFEILPVIAGVPEGALKVKQPILTAELLAALELIRLNTDPAHANSSQFHARVLDISKGYRIDVRDQNGALLTFGLDDLDAQLQRLKRVRGEVANLGQELAETNLMLERNIPIKFIPPRAPEEDAFPPLPPSNPAKPSTKELKSKKKPEPPKREPKKPNPDNGLFKPFLRV